MSKSTRKNIVVLGGGSGGVAAAANLGHAVGDDHNVILIERQPIHIYQPAFLMLMAGLQRAGDITRDITLLERHNVRVIVSTIHGIDTQAQQLYLDGEKLSYDYLIVSLGLQTHPEAIPGAAEGAQHAWDLDAAVRTHDAVRQFSGGTVVVGQPAGPYRCPPAPYETLYMLDTYFHERGIRSRTDIHFVAPIDRPTGDERSPTRWLAERAEERGVTTHFNFTVGQVDPDGHTVRSTDGQSLSYDLLFMIPPHRPAQVLVDSGISEPTGVEVDYDYLTTSIDNVWAIGDCVNFPASKAGVVAHQQADLVAHNLALQLKGESRRERFKLHTT